VPNLDGGIFDRRDEGGSAPADDASSKVPNIQPHYVPCEVICLHAYLVKAMETDEPIEINGNVPNRGPVHGLPYGCCVEVPCLVDANGAQPTVLGHYAVQLAALNTTNINVQELTVETALSGDVEAVHHAVMLDPLTAAVCTLPQIRSMVDEMLDAQAKWLPQFTGITA
jgi:alpha-galactosidase